MPIGHKHSHEGRNDDDWGAEYVHKKKTPKIPSRTESIPYAIPVGKLEQKKMPPMGILVDSTRSRAKRVMQPPASGEKPYRVTEQDIVLTAEDLMKMPVTLSDELFARLFPKGVLPQQTNVGNCWAVAALTVTRNYPYFKTIIQRSMRPLFHGGKHTGWGVRIPLGNAHGNEIHLQNSEIDHDAMDAPLGIHILEAVIGKREVRRGKKKKVPLYGPDGELNLSQIMSGGHSELALRYLFGKSAHESSIGDDDDPTLAKAENDVQREAVRYLANFSPYFDIATFSTSPGPDGKGGRFTLAGVNAQFLYRHAYAIRSVNVAKQTVTVQDPRLEKTLTLTWPQAFKIFTKIDRIELFRAHRDEQQKKKRA